MRKIRLYGFTPVRYFSIISMIIKGILMKGEVMALDSSPVPEWAGINHKNIKELRLSSQAAEALNREGLTCMTKSPSSRPLSSKGSLQKFARRSSS
ncbi:MAG: hypothetical protein ACOX25_09435 [Caldicoprobacterales bacterium]|jgi:hypothetical protein